MAALSWHAGAPKDGSGLPSVRRFRRIAGFPKSVRLLRPRDFRKVYDEGQKYQGPYFAAFFLGQQGCSGPKVGFTLPRAVGKSVERNRMRRRLREAVRLHLSRLGGEWMVVINPRRRALEAPFAELEREVVDLFRRCGPA